MDIEDGGLEEVIVEAVGEHEDEDPCPCCETMNLLRCIARYPGGTCWVLYCGSCGKALEHRWHYLT